MIHCDYLFVGAGQTAFHACQALRQYDAKGSVMLIGDDHFPPHNLPVLDKVWFKQGLTSADSVTVVPPGWFESHKIDYRPSTLVTQFNIERRMAVLNTGQTIEFKKALLATGSRPKRPQIAGFNLGNIIYPRTSHDLGAIREISSHEKACVVIGSGIAGLQYAAALKSSNHNVILLSGDKFLLDGLVDAPTGQFLNDYALAHGLKLTLEENLNGFEGKTVLKNIQLKSGTRFSAGMAVVALGSEPDLRLVTGTPLSSTNGCPVNEYLETDEKGIYAAGSLALYPDRIFGSVRRWDYPGCAELQGQTAGANITGRKRQKFEYLPDFSLNFFDLHLQFIGDFSKPIVRTQLVGDYAKKKFTLTCLQGEKVVAAVLCNQPPEAHEAATLQIRSSFKSS